MDAMRCSLEVNEIGPHDINVSIHLLVAFVSNASDGKEQSARTTSLKSELPHT